MTAELGVFFLILALLCALLQAAFLWPNPVLRHRLAHCLLPAAWLQALCVACAFAALIILRVDSDFSVAIVAAHSNLSLPLLYKITGAWGNHEGSMVLWLLVLSAFGLALGLRPARTAGIVPSAMAVQSALAAGVLLFILFTSNPFARQFPPPFDGDAFNPILQDIALALHPPLLYVGYVGFSLVFSLAVAALIRGDAGRNFAKTLRPWILISWTSLTLGIGLGSWWAYRELGWGGFWFWDPVENASLLPWLAGTALLHSNIVLEKRGALASWVVLLAIITFALSLLGTFLVRSGALTSVHSFATDPARGLFILGYIVVAVGGALLLFARRAPALESAEPMLPASREGAIVGNNIFLLSACAVVLLGTIYPLLAEWMSGEKLTVGAPYFKATFVPIMVAPLLLAGLAPLLPWRRAKLADMAQTVKPVALAAAAAVLLTLAFTQTHIVMATAGIGLAVWLFFSSGQWLRGNWRNPNRAYTLSVFLGHAGVAVLVLGITGVGAWQEEQSRVLRANDAIDIGGYHLVYRGDTTVSHDNYDARRGEFTVESDNQPVTTLFPEYRTYKIRDTATHEAAIHSAWAADLYAVIGETSADGKRTAVRIYYVPLIRLVWLGCILIALAGGIAAVRKVVS